MPDVTVTCTIAASTDAVWNVVSDLPRRGELPPENQGGNRPGMEETLRRLEEKLATAS